jgi:hypothetical protein
MSDSGDSYTEEEYEATPLAISEGSDIDDAFQKIVEAGQQIREEELPPSTQYNSKKSVESKKVKVQHDYAKYAEMPGGQPTRHVIVKDRQDRQDEEIFPKIDVEKMHQEQLALKQNSAGYKTTAIPKKVIDFNYKMALQRMIRHNPKREHPTRREFIL